MALKNMKIKVKGYGTCDDESMGDGIIALTQETVDPAILAYLMYVGDIEFEIDITEQQFRDVVKEGISKPSAIDAASQRIFHENNK